MLNFRGRTKINGQSRPIGRKSRCALRLPALSDVKLNDPLRLDVAAALAYPDGSMTASGLRKEADKGRLVVERTAGKDYTTLGADERRRELCRKTPKALDCGSAKREETSPGGPHTERSGSSATETIKRALSAAAMIVAELKGRSSPTSTA